MWCACASAANEDHLLEGFRAPPNGAKPLVSWHWLGGSISKKGIELDLEWMRRIGVGGVVQFDATSDFLLSGERLRYMTRDWAEALRHAVVLAGRKGLGFAVASAPGWSLAGGPWVSPDDAMKKLVWSEMDVDGGKRFEGKLPRPVSMVGPFLNQPVDWRNPLSGRPPLRQTPEVYRDVAVVAYRLAPQERLFAEARPVVTSSAGTIDAGLIADNDYGTGVTLPTPSDGSPAWLALDYGRPVPAESLSVALEGNDAIRFFAPQSDTVAELQASADGLRFDPIVTVNDSTDAQQTVTFAKRTARYFRLMLPPLRVPPTAALLGIASPLTQRVTELALYAVPRVDHFEQKAGFFAWVLHVDPAIDRRATRPVPPGETIDRNAVLDLTARLGVDGSLDWTPPSGRWAVLRFGYSLLGTTNHPASLEATGLEVDKLNRLAVNRYINTYLDQFEAVLGPRLMGRAGVQAVESDSWEAGAQNWTDTLPEEFLRRRGYDLRPWLPALAGRIIDSAEVTDRFLWDFRRTLGDLTAENHYGELAAALHKRGLLYYSQSHETGRAFVGDGMDAKRSADFPMGAMWVGNFVATPRQFDADLLESASVAHIYGKDVVAAESLTAFGAPGMAFALAPKDLKAAADRELADGVNRLVIHTSVHQPLIGPAPGLSLAPFGQWFTRNETWADQAGPWMSYLARSCYLLQQGRFVADIVYFYGQDTNITALQIGTWPLIPSGYAFDFASVDALGKLSVSDGRLVSDSGMSYRVLALDPRTTSMSLDVLRRLAALIDSGAVVVGDKPRSTPSLSDDEHDFRALADLLWSTGASGEHHYGLGRTISGRSLGDVLQSLGVAPDFSYAGKDADTTIRFLHRRLADGDLYFVSNQSSQFARLNARFRVSGKEAQLWHADTGGVEEASFSQGPGSTVVPLQLGPEEAVFVVFRRDAAESARYVPKAAADPVGTLSGPWTVRFQKRRGAPAVVGLQHLESWTANSDPRIKYFSGTATYSYQPGLRMPAQSERRGQRIAIDLGKVDSLAELLVNGRSICVAWKQPFRCEITSWLRSGINRLDIRVTNVWSNRLIGDKQPNAQPVAFSNFNPYRADSPLSESGLLGPVEILRSRQVSSSSNP